MSHPPSASDQRPAIACDMSAAPDTPAQRLQEYRRLFAGHLSGRERSGTGITFRFRADPGLEEWVRDLAVREQACCAFFRIGVSRAGDEVRWDMSVIDDDVARQILAEFYRLPDTLADEAAGAGTSTAPGQGKPPASRC
jgi:hypothetical protein